MFVPVQNAFIEIDKTILVESGFLKRIFQVERFIDLESFTIIYHNFVD